MKASPQHIELWLKFQGDWNKFARDYLRVTLDNEQQEVLHSVQVNPKTAVASGTSRGKDYVTAVGAVSFMYLTPNWDAKGNLVGNTKVILSGPTGRQVKKIMMPEVSRVFRNAIYLPGELTSDTIRTPYDEWFLHAFKADDTNIEAWTGFHAVNIFFGITEATGMVQQVFDAIEGNLQGNSRLLIVFNPNINVGYAANAMRSPQFHKIRLNSLNAPNVVAKKLIYPGQVDYEWITGRIADWCQEINESERSDLEGDFTFEGRLLRPNDLFRAKVLGLFPKVSEGTLVPMEWIEAAQANYKRFKAGKLNLKPSPLRLGLDVAGMGRDISSFCFRFGKVLDRFETMKGNSATIHMEVAGKTRQVLQANTDTFKGLHAQAFIDTIGEGAGVYSRLVEQETENVHSCKFSEAAKNGAGKELKDHTGQYSFLNMRAWLYWAIRDWLNPDNQNEACLPDDPELVEELTQITWKFMSNGKIKIEEKDEIKKRIKRSPDKSDSLANTFWPVPDLPANPGQKGKKAANYFF